MLPDADQFEPVGKGAGRKEPSSPEPGDETGDAAYEVFPMAVDMLVQCWSRQNKKRMRFHMGFSEQQVEDMVKKLNARFDHSARDMLKHSKLADRPTYEELKAARDRGPEALAELIAKRAPAMLTDIGVGAAVAEVPEFMAALLKCGLDPKATGCRGITPLNAAAPHGQTSAIYQLVKSAADKQT